MNWAAWILIVMHIMALLMSMYMVGKPRRDLYYGRDTPFFVLVQLTLLLFAVEVI